MSLDSSDLNRRIKWGYATHTIDDPPACGGDLRGRLLTSEDPPNRNDVIVAEVLALGRHSRIELTSGRRARLFPGDLIGIAYGNRYATRQWCGVMPEHGDVCHLLSVGGVCGEVITMVPDFKEPTVLRPLGYLSGPDGKRLNLGDFALQPRVSGESRPTTILVVGSGMDSGKTTAAASLIHGLALSGAKVFAAKLTGTAAPKDLWYMEDSGAARVMDFTDVGHASTAGASNDELWRILTTVESHFAVENPDYVVLEIADGIAQRETTMLLELAQSHGCIDHVIYTCCDSPGAQVGVERVRNYGMHVVAVAGMVACGPLAAQEARALTDVPVLESADLSNPSVTSMLVKPAAVENRRGAVG